MNVLGVILLIVIVFVLVILLNGWLLMMFLGCAHASISAVIPAVGFGACIWPAFFLTALLGTSASSARS